ASIREVLDHWTIAASLPSSEPDAVMVGHLTPVRRGLKRLMSTDDDSRW
ncbi:MAG: hypothetical protein QOK39_839, partial [Acidimicrobiaceae bacterium]|nr:hypothetical protein [Acidimicrobiaceae bacterium]